MKKQRVVQSIKGELKGSARQSKPELLEKLRKALARRGIK